MGKILAFFCVFAVAVSYFALNSYLLNRTIARHEDQFNHGQLVQTSLACRAIDATMDSVVRMSDILATYSLVEFATGVRNEDSIERLFKQMIDGCDVTVAYAYFSAPGKMRVSMAAGDGFGEKALKVANRWSYDWWVESAGQEGHYVPPLHITSLTQFMGLVMPVYVSGERRGTLVTVIDLRSIMDDYVAPLRSGRYGAGYALSGQGTVVYDHETEVIGRNVMSGMHSKYPQLEAVDRRLISEASGMAEYSFTIERGGEISRKLIAWNSVVVGDRKLVVCLSAPDIEMDAALRETKVFQALSGGLLAMLAGTVLVVAFRRESARRLKESEHRLTSALEGNRDGVWDWDVPGETVYFSKRWLQVMGYGAEERQAPVSEWAMRIHPDDVQEVSQRLNRHLMSGETEYYESEHRMLCRDGRYKWVLDRGKVLERDKDGNALRFIGTVTDISRRKEAEEEVRKLSLAVEHSPSPVIITDSGGVIQFVNHSFEEVTGYSRQEAIGSKPSILKSGRQSSELYDRMWKTISSGEVWRGELVNRNKDGSEIWVRVSISPVLDDAGRIVNYIGVQEDLTELKHKEEALRSLATTDDLTGIDNRRQFMREAKRELKRTDRTGLPLVMVMFDLDHFKRVNDSFGHAVGDQVLRRVAEVVKGSIRGFDIFGRLGGEEFGLVLPRVNMEQAMRVCERIRCAIEADSMNFQDVEVSITVSLGLAAYGDYARDVDSLLRLADMALYEAKQTGRNRVVGAKVPVQ